MRGGIRLLDQKKVMPGIPVWMVLLAFVFGGGLAWACSEATLEPEGPVAEASIGVISITRCPTDAKALVECELPANPDSLRTEEVYRVEALTLGAVWVDVAMLFKDAARCGDKTCVFGGQWGPFDKPTRRELISFGVFFAYPTDYELVFVLFNERYEELGRRSAFYTAYGPRPPSPQDRTMSLSPSLYER